MLSERSKTGVMNTVFKSGQLFISSRGIGWKSWRKRWFILTRTSLVFFKNDPSALSQRGGEVNLTLGGIDLNNSGSVVVREDKKLLTVLFPDGRDGRAFTLKAESSEDLFEWKTALEHALAQAPSAALVMGHNGIFQNEADNTTDESFQRYKRPAKSMVVERPILLALEDIDGGPSFLEKALRFLEKFGIKIEGILRQSADVEDVYRRVQEYEQGRNQFSFDEDAHVVGDCVKYALRELPSSPVPASCCISLLEASRIEQKESQLNAFRSAIFETFPEPNRRLLQRILKMMHIVASHASENRMTPSALAACMAPLLLRPLLAGECELEEDFAMSDISAQLLAAANAANNAQAIVAILLEDYDKIFNRSEGDGGSDIESIGETNGISNHKSLRGSNFHLNDQDICKKESESPIPETHTPNSLPYGKPNQSMSDLLSPKEQGLHVPIAGPHLHAEKSTSKLASYSFNAKRQSFWGKNNARKNLSVESFDSSGEEELAIQRLETTKNDLRNRIAKEANGNAVLQASLERRKQALHERRLALEHDVSRLQEQLQAERDLRADLEIGLSMSPGQFFNSRGMNPKTRAELEEIALAEADVARLKQKVTELHLQLNQQSQNHYGTLSDASDHYQHLQNLHSQQKVLQQNFDTTVAFCNHEATQRTEESSLGADRRNMKEQVFLSATNSKQLFLKLYGESASLSNSKSTEASTSFSADEFSAVDSASAPSTSRPIEATEYPRHHPSVPSSTLVELTTRLDFFKDRRNQLMEQLHNLDASFATSTCQNLVYKQQPSFPPPK